MPNYPGSLDSLTNPTSVSPLVAPDHAAQHTDVNDIVEAIEAKVGIGASVATAGDLLVGTGAGATAFRSPATIGLQPLDPDLTAIGALAPADDDIIQRKAGAWANRTIAQLKVDLGQVPASWTPGLSLATPGSSSFTYTTQSGTSRAWGPLIWVRANILTSAFSVGTGSGALQLTGLPVNPASEVYLNVALQGYTNAALTQVNLLVSTGGVATFIGYGSGTSAANITGAMMANPIRVRLTAVYATE